MGGQRAWRNRFMTATVILVLLSASECLATIYSIDPDGIINPTASPEPVVPPWRWTVEDEIPVTRHQPRPPPPPRPRPPPPLRRPPSRPPSRPPLPPPPRGNTYHARKPQWPLQLSNEFPEAWKKALRRAAFQSLRNGATTLFGYRGITPSIQDDVDQELWHRLSIADFIGTREERDPDLEEEQTDIMTLAEGLLLHKDGELLFFISDGISSCPCEDARTLATWFIRRLRHSGPGRERPQYQLHFSVIPIVEEQQIEIQPVALEPFRHNPSPLYRGIPIFTRNGLREYNPRFIEEYGAVVSAFLRQRDSLPKYQTIKENRDQNKNQPQQYFPIYEPQVPPQQYSKTTQDEFNIPTREEFHIPQKEEYRVLLTEEFHKPQQENFRESLRQNYHQHYEDEHYTTYQPQDNESDEEYHQQYRGRQQSSNSRRQNIQYYRQKYTNYQPHHEARQQYHHHYRDQSASFSGFHQPSSELKVFKPSTPFERYSEVDPLYKNGKPQDQKAVSQVLVTRHEQLPQVSLIPVQAIERIEIPIEDLFKTDWDHHELGSASQEKQSESHRSSSVSGSTRDWTTINSQTKQLGTQENMDTAPLNPKLQSFSTNSYNETFSNQSHTKSKNNHRSLGQTYPIGSQSLSALTRVTEHLSQSFNNERPTATRTKFSSWNESVGVQTDFNRKTQTKRMEK